MNKEFAFFIEENHYLVKALAAQKIHDGYIPVANNHGLLYELSRRTQPGDTVTFAIAGAWLEVCVYKSVRDALNPRDRSLDRREILGIVIDMAACVAWADPDMSIGDKRNLIRKKLGELADDSRLTILPLVDNIRYD